MHIHRCSCIYMRSDVALLHTTAIKYLVREVRQNMTSTSVVAEWWWCPAQLIEGITYNTINSTTSKAV